MKKLIIVLISVILLLALTSCDFNNVFDVFDEVVTDYPYEFKVANPYSTFKPILIVLDSVTEENGVRTIILEWRNLTDSEVIYTKDYTIEYYDGNVWKDVRAEGIEVEDVAYVLLPHTNVFESYSTEGFDLSAGGKYRLTTEFKVSNESGMTTGKAGVEIYLNSKDPLKMEAFDLTVIGEEWLFEPLSPKYIPGTEVTMKIKAATESTATFVSINNKYVSQWVNHEDRRYTYITFTMPYEPLEIYIIPYSNIPFAGGKADFPYQNPFYGAYWAKFPEQKDVQFRKYYGEYNTREHCQVAMMSCSSDSIAGFEPWVETVAGFEFEYRDQQRIWLYDNFTVYSLTDAYSLGLITKEDVEDIANKHREALDELYSAPKK